ncbi:MAG: flavodoxin family protein [Clostridiales bacterium]|jgi:multimeric flavodoxin WrbA|nr:flavodoxin family protein [Eubacteriales bacterium]MDH7566409.1 flavodoxin family protein [Clostridiales bacterium]
MIVAVYGSPRKGGNTDILLDSFLQPISRHESIDRFYLRDLTLKPCIACGKCDKTGICIFNDDLWGIYEKIESASAVVLSSPIHFASVTSIMKIFVDRAQPFWARKYLLGRKNPHPERKGFFICSGAINTDKHFLNSKLVIQTLFKNLDIEYSGDLFFSGVDGKGEIRNKAGAIHSASCSGTDFLKRLESGT